MNTKSTLKKSGTAALALFLVLLAGLANPGHAAQPDAEQLMKQAISVESAAQKKQSAWEGRRSAMLDEIRQLESENLWLSFQERKYARYVSSMEDRIAELERVKTELERLEQELEPLLYGLVDRLKTGVDNDLPFLKDERARRLAFLDKTLDDHTLSNGEKLRRILEAVEVETAYGRSTELTEKQVVLEGRPTQVTVIRAGRLGLYCLTPDKTSAGKFSPETGEFESLPSEFAPSLTQLETMIEHKRFTNFAFLPVKEAR